MHFANISGGKSGSNCPRARALPVVFLISAATAVGVGGSAEQWVRFSEMGSMRKLSTLLPPRDEVSGDVLNLTLASHQMLGLQQEHRIPAHSARSLRCDLWQITVSLEFSVFDYKGRGLG